jgi:hypothetical protein
MLVKDLYYEKYLKYKNKYLNLQSQIGGSPVFITIIDLEEPILVVPASPYEEYAYNKYFAIKEQSITREVAHEEVYEGMRITYTIKFSGEVYFDIFKDDLTYRFHIKDFKEEEMGNESFCILVNDKNVEQVLSNNKQLLEAFATEEEVQKLWRIQHKQRQIDSRMQKDNEYREQLHQKQEREEAEKALREGKVFIAFPTQISGYIPSYQVAEAKSYQKEAYKIFRKFITGEIPTNSVTETVDDMEIKASIGTGRGYIQFFIKKNFEQIPYDFKITPFSDRFRDEVKYSLFCDLIANDTGQISYLSNNEPLLRRWVHNKMKGEAH